MLRIIKISLRIIKINPILFLRRIFLELRAPFLNIKNIKIKSLNGVIFEFTFKEDPYIKLMYAGLYEMGVIHAMKLLLKEGDTFIDVGANIGYISAIATGFVGTRGKIYSFEPVPKYFKELQNFAAANKEYIINPYQIALGDEEKDIKIYVANRNIGSNTVLPDLLEKNQVESSIIVPMRRLDNYIEEKGFKNIKMIKIDVEGFEFSVLKGLEGFFLKEKQLPYIICEISSNAWDILDYKLDDLLNYMKKFSYLPYEPVNPAKRLSMSVIRKEHTINVLFKPKKISI